MSRASCDGCGRTPPSVFPGGRYNAVVGSVYMCDDCWYHSRIAERPEVWP